MFGAYGLLDGSVPQEMHIFDKIGGALFGGGGAKPVAGSQAMTEAATDYSKQFKDSGATGQALGNLTNILGSDGRSDPRFYNQLENRAVRDTEAINAGTRAALAQSGFGQQSGLAQALMAANSAAGAGRLTDLRAQELREAEDRKRQDLELFMSMFMPNVSLANLGSSNINTANARADAQAKAGMDFIGSIIGGAMPG